MRTNGNTGIERWKVELFVLMQVRDQLGMGAVHVVLLLQRSGIQAAYRAG